MDLKVTDIKFISGIESWPEEEITKTLVSETEPEQVSCVNWKEYPYAPEVLVHLAYSDKALVLLYKVKEEHVLGNVLENNGAVWEDSCVETFIKDPVGEGYYNIEVNCIGTRLAAHRLSRTDFELFKPEKLSKIGCVASLPHQITDISDAADKEWMIGELIPFEVLGLDAAPESLEVNFYKCGDKCRQPHFLSWSPIGLPEPNFHCPEFFGKINLIK